MRAGWIRRRLALSTRLFVWVESVPIADDPIYIFQNRLQIVF